MSAWKLTAEAGGGVDIEDGTYLVEVTAIEETVFEDSQYKKGPQKSAKFYLDLPDVTDEDRKPVSLTATASAEKLTPKTKLWGWVEALTGEQLEAGQTVNLDGLVGCRAFALVNNEVDKEGAKWARVKSLMPLPKTTGLPLPTAAPSQVDPYAGFRTDKSEIDWGKFKAEYEARALTLGDIGKFLSVESVTPKGIRLWLEAEPDRSLASLIADVAAVSGLEDLPFE
jgi:hypothetical protein